MKIKFKPNLARPQGARGAKATRSSHKGGATNEEQKSNEEDTLSEKPTGTKSREGPDENHAGCVEDHAIVAEPHSSHTSPAKPGEASGTSTSHQPLSTGREGVENAAVKCTEEGSLAPLQDGALCIEEEGVEPASSPARPNVSSQAAPIGNAKQGGCARKRSSSPVKEKQVLDRRRSKSTSTSTTVTPEESGSGAAKTGKSRKRKRGSCKTAPVPGGVAAAEEKSPSPKKQRRSASRPGCVAEGEGSPDSKKQQRSTSRVREAPNRSTMTMQELIYYNPTANPMSAKLDDLKRRKEDSSKSSPAPSKSTTPVPSGEGGGHGERGDGGEVGEEGEEEGRIVPKLRVGADGNIVIDEESMVVEATHQVELPGYISEITEGSNHTTSASYRNRKYKITKWSREETSKFFKALSQVGTDFTMMTLLLPSRSRKELKNKFKKEERLNPYLISQALTTLQALPRTQRI